MTKRQYMAKVRELVRTQSATIIERAEQLWHSGAIEPSDYDDDFLLPKAVVHVLDKEMASSWRPFTDEGRELAKNLKHF